MAQTKLFQRSFIGGELSPRMFGRVDSVDYANGAKTIQNAVVMPQGAARKRGGMRLVREVRDSTKRVRLVEFKFSLTETAVIELGDLYARFHTNGATVPHPVAPAYVGNRQFAEADVNVGTGEITFPVVHGLADNEPIEFTSLPGAVLPAPLQANVIYYTALVSPTVIGVRAAPGDTPITLLDDGTTSIPALNVLHRAYRLGDFVQSLGFTWYCLRRAVWESGVSAALSLTPGSDDPSIQPPSWYSQPLTGEFEIPAPYPEADLASLTHVQSLDVTTFAHPAHQLHELRRYGPTRWEFAPRVLRPLLDPPTGVVGTSSPGETVLIDLIEPKAGVTSPGSIRIRTTGVLDLYAVGDTFWVRDSRIPQLNDRLLTLQNKLGSSTLAWFYTFDGGVPIDLEIPDPSAPWNVTVNAGTDYVFWPEQTLAEGTCVRFPVPPTGLSSSTDYYTCNHVGTSFQVSTTWPTLTIAPITGSAPGQQIALYPTGAIPANSQGRLQPASRIDDGVQEYVVTAVGADRGESEASAVVSITNNLYVRNAYNTITWNAVPGAVRYRVFKKLTGLFGFIGETEDLTFKDDNIGPDLGQTPPRIDATVNLPGSYPAACGYYEGRFVVAGAANNPQSFWMTRSGTENQMTFSLPITDEDRIYRQVAALENCAIRHVVPLAQLVLLTDSTEFLVLPVDSDVLTPRSTQVRPATYVGAGQARPLVVNLSVLYAAARGGHVRELGFGDQGRALVVGDLSLRSAHRFVGRDIVASAFSKAPAPVAWFVSSDGTLCSLTYIPEERVGAWAFHQTDGVVESVACVAEGLEDRVYVVVRRWVGGTPKRYIERLDPLDQAGAAYLDCAVSYAGSPTPTISGLPYPDGTRVYAVAAGNTYGPLVASGGAVTLPVPVTSAVVGLSYRMEVETLPAVAQVEALGQGRAKAVNRVWLRHRGGGRVMVGPTADRLSADRLDGSVPSGEPDVGELSLVGKWTQDGSVLIRHDDPMAFEIVSMSVEVSFGG